jgi:Protein of unknown function (DUF3800)
VSEFGRQPVDSLAGSDGNGCFIVLQACIDESGHGDPDLFVLAGYVSTTEHWAAFSDKWQELLDHDSKYYRKLEHFHMTEMTGSVGDRERCRWFHNVIEQHALLAISYTLSVKDVRREADRMFSDPKVRRELSNPWQLATSSMLSMLASNREKMALPVEPIDFVFDETSEKGAVLSSWELFKAVHPPEQAKLMGSTPIFRNDREYLPLQAADMFAWWVRRWQVDGVKGNAIYQCQFPWPRSHGMQWVHISPIRNQIRARLRGLRDRVYGTYQINASTPFSWRSS